MQPDRLSVIDDMFYRGHHGLGVEVVMQGIWRFDDQVTADDLRPSLAALAASQLTRRVVSSRVPWARRYFTDGARIAPARVHPGVLESSAVLAWADDCAHARLDVDNGPMWEVALARLDSGGSLVSLTCSHLVADGVGLLGVANSAVDTATASDAVAASPLVRPRVRDDIADAVGLWSRVVVAVVRALWRGCVDASVRAELVGALRRPPRQPVAPSTPGPRDTAIIEIDSHEWDRYVDRCGATSTAAEVAVTADIVGALRGSGPVDIAVPMAGGAGQPLTMAAVTADQGMEPVMCADALRVAYARAGSGSGLGPPGGMPAELLQLLGDRFAHALVPAPGTREALVSPLGDLGAGFDRLGDHHAIGVAVRSVYPRSGTSGTDQGSPRLGVWSARSCGRVVLSLVARDQPENARLADVAVQALQRRGLTARSW